MKRKLSMLVVLLLSITDVMAVEWTSIVKDTAHEVFVDIDSYNVSDNHPYLIAKTIYQEPQHFTLPNKKIKYFITVAKFQFNCQPPLYRLRTIKLMNKKNTLIDTIKINGGFQKLATNTDEFSIGQLTCQVHQMLGGPSH